MSEPQNQTATPADRKSEKQPPLPRAWLILLKSLIIPVLVFIFYAAAPGWLNYRLQSGFLKSIDENTETTLVAKQQQEEIVGRLDFGSVCEQAPADLQSLAEHLEKSGVCGQFQRLRWGFWASTLLLATHALGISILSLFNPFARRSQGHLIFYYRQGWRLTMALAIFQVFLLTPLLTYAAFEFTVLLADRYYPQLLFVIGLCGLLGIWTSAKILLAKVPLEFTETLVREITPQDSPELWSAVRQAAKDLQTSPPDHIIVGAKASFFVTELAVKYGTGRVEGKTLFLSFPLLRQLTESEVLAVVGHELGHFMGEDTRMTREFFPLRMKTRATMVAMARSAYAGWTSLHLVGFFDWSFEAAESQVSRERELLADRIGARLTSPGLFGRTLIRLHVLAEALNRSIEDSIKNRAPIPLNMALHGVVRDKLMPDSDYWARLFEQKLPHPLDSHPSLRVRLEALGVHPDTSEAQSMSTEVVESAYTRWFGDRDHLFAQITEQATAAIGKAQSQSEVAQANYQTEEGRELLNRHFPPKKWFVKPSRLHSTTTVMGLLAFLCLVPAFFAEARQFLPVLCVLALVPIAAIVIAWKRHHRGVLSLNASGMEYSGWNQSLLFQDVASLAGQNHSGTVVLTFHLKEKQFPRWKCALLRFPSKSFTLPISGYNEKPMPIAETIFRYYHRQLPVAAEEASPASLD